MRTTDDILDDVLMRVRRSDVLVLWADKSTKGADWLPLLGALAHAEAADEFIAKTKICDLMATRKNRVRVTTDTGEIFTDVKLHVPEDLRPEDIDWPNSRPLRPWFVGPGVCRKRARDERRGPARQINLVELNVDHLRARASASCEAMGGRTASGRGRIRRSPRSAIPRARNLRAR